MQAVKDGSEFKVIIVVKCLGYHQGLFCCTLQMAWLHSQMSALVLSPESPSTDFSPCFVPGKHPAWSQLHGLLCAAPHAQQHCAGSQVASLLLALFSLPASWSWHRISQFCFLSQPGRHVKRNYLPLQGKGENERQVRVDPSIAEGWAKRTDRSRAGAKTLTQLLRSVDCAFLPKEKKKTDPSSQTNINRGSRSNPFCFRFCTVLSWH